MLVKGVPIKAHVSEATDILTARFGLRNNASVSRLDSFCKGFCNYIPKFMSVWKTSAS